MDPIEALLTKKLDEVESIVYFLENSKEQHSPHPYAAALLSKLSFLKSLLAAEIGGSNAAGRLNHIAARISALEFIFSSADDPKTVTFRLRLAILHKNLQELESMANEPFCRQSATKIRRKLAFTKSLLNVEDQSEDLSFLRERIAAVDETFVHLNADEGTQPSCSSTSCHTEEVGEEEADVLSLRKIVEIEKENNGDDYNDVQTEIGFLRSLLAAERKLKGGEKVGEIDDSVKRFSSIINEIADQNRVPDDAIGGNVSSSCSCTSSCFDGGQEEEKQADEEENCVYGGNETRKLCAVETEEIIHGKSETADSEGGDGERRFGKHQAMGSMAGVFAVAAVGVAVGSFNETGELCAVETEKVMEGESETADSEGGDGEKRFGMLRAMGAMAGVFAVAVIGVAVGSFFSEKVMVYVVPT